MHNPFHSSLQRTLSKRGCCISTPKMVTSPLMLSSISGEEIFYDVIQDYLPSEDEDSVYSSIGYLNIHKGDVLQFISRAPTNLLYVRLVNRLGDGLVPTSCLALKHELSGNVNGGCAASLDISGDVQPHGSRETAALQDCQITDCSIRDSRVCYRVECEMKSGERRVLCRYYQDFYLLHLRLLECIHLHRTPAPVQLPRLPAPTGNVRDKLTIGRAQEMNDYICGILRSQYLPKAVKLDIIINDCLEPRVGDIVKAGKVSYMAIKGSRSNKKKTELAWVTFFGCDANDKTASSEDSISRAPSKHQSMASQTLPAEAPPPIRTPISPPCTPTLPSMKGFPQKGRPSSSHSTLDNFLTSSPASLKSDNSSHMSSQTDVFPSSQPSSSKTAPLEIKIHYNDDLFVVRCSWNSIADYELLDRTIRRKLCRHLPTETCELHLSRKVIDLDTKKSKNYSKSYSKEVALSCDNYQEVMCDLRSFNDKGCKKYSDKGVGVAYNVTEPMSCSPSPLSPTHRSSFSASKLFPQGKTSIVVRTNETT